MVTGIRLTLPKEFYQIHYMILADGGLKKKKQGATFSHSLSQTQLSNHFEKMFGAVQLQFFS